MAVDEHAQERPILIAMLLRDRGPTGVQTHVRVWREWLAGQGRAAQLVTPFDAPVWARGILFAMIALRHVLHRMAPSWAVGLYRGGHAWCLRQALRTHLNHQAARAVYAQCPVSASVALGLPAALRGAVVLAVHFNDSQADEWADKGQIRLGGRMYRRIQAFEQKWLPAVDALVFVSRYMQDRVGQRHPECAALPQQVISNFVPTPDKPESTCASGPGGDLICIGTLEPRKNQQYGLEILAAALQQGRELSLTIVGDGPDRAALAARAAELGVAAQVRFTGYVERAASLIHRHRALLHVAQQEAQGIVLLEALACGKPVFAVPVGGIPEVLEDGVVCQHLPADDAAGAARYLLATLDDPALMAAMGQAGQARYRAHFSPDQVAVQLECFVRGIADRRSSAVSPPAPSPGL